MKSLKISEINCKHGFRDGDQIPPGKCFSLGVRIGKIIARKNSHASFRIVFSGGDTNPIRLVTDDELDLSGRVSCNGLREIGRRELEEQRIFEVVHGVEVFPTTSIVD